MEVAGLQEWCKKELSQLAGNDLDDELIRYLLSLKTESSIEEYINSVFQQLLPKERNSVQRQQCGRFLREYLVRWRSIQTDDDIMVPLKRLEDDQMILFEKKSKTKKKKSGLAPPPGLHPPPPSAQSKTKYVPLLGSKGQDKLFLNIPGRHPCHCLGQKHDLVNNCLECGRIICTQEGAGPCLFCGAVVFTREDEQILSRDSKRAEKLREKMWNQYNIRGNNPLSLYNSDGDLAKANEHKDKLVTFDRTSKRRTTVVDDESDYFKVDSQWLSEKDRAALKKKEDELRDVKYGSRLSRGVHVTLDITGRSVTEEDEREIDLYSEDHIQEITSDATCTSSYEVVQRGLFNPSIPVPPPVYFGKKVKGHKSTARMPQITRIQDKGILEMRDEGKCLSMHQPWASLLVHGIKRYEGRSWYTPHRGKLWIASTAQVAEREAIDQLEQHYSRLNNDDSIDFPDSYPSSCVLGCVDIVNCLSNEECKEMYPDCDSDSPFVFVCDNPQILIVKFPVKGRHKIWRLEDDMHAAAKRATQIVSSL